ncbi:hypothetical protein ACFWNK_21800 [Streptomyces sp. NPDC058417]|uniref:hypothetical protein n=1 Tax=unclassified Streptomyces TaxID=2593676 RepID=UPI0036553DD6
MQTNTTYAYAGRHIVDRSPMPDGRMLVVAYGDGVQLWATGFLGEDNGQYFTESKDVWKNYALRLAEGLGLVVAPASAVWALSSPRRAPWWTPPSRSSR